MDNLSQPDRYNLTKYAPLAVEEIRWLWLNGMVIIGFPSNSINLTILNLRRDPFNLVF
jgi:hypothetical protein